jgi:hypothetical protein
VSPLNRPADLGLVDVVRDASTSSFHLAMLLGAGLLLLGALVNAVGITNAAARKPQELEPAATPEPAASAPV